MGEGKKLKYDAETKKMCKQAITGSKDWKDKEEMLRQVFIEASRKVAKVLEAFKKWDKDGNGFISKDELADVRLDAGKDLGDGIGVDVGPQAYFTGVQVGGEAK
eukprot:Skav222114  [mRNA]  locus=scaffold1181:383143:384111:- [translate_table: standard]